MAPCDDVWAPAALSYFTAVVCIILLLVITCGNTGIIMAVVADPLRKLRTPFNYFLLNLATSDLLVGVVVMPATAAVHFEEATGWIDSSLRYVIHIAYLVSATASLLSLSALSLDRYSAIKWPIEYRSLLSLRRYAFISTLIVAVSVSISMLYFLTGFIDYLMVFAHIAVLLTFVTLLLTYIKVNRAFTDQTKNFPQTADTRRETVRNQLNAIRSESKVTRTFLWILGFFIAAYAPAMAMIYVLQFCNQCDCLFRHILRDLHFVFVSINSGINPVICFIRLKAFRDSILIMLKLKSKITQPNEIYVLQNRAATLKVTEVQDIEVTM